MGISPVVEILGGVDEDFDESQLYFQVAEIEDDWETIVANKGQKYNYGNYKLLETNDETLGTVRMQKACGKTEEGNSTWIAMDISQSSIVKGGTYGSWYDSNLREYLNHRLFQQLPGALQIGIKEVTKYSRSAVAGEYLTNYETMDRLWIPSSYEWVGDEPSYAEFCESKGIKYNCVLYKGMPIPCTYKTQQTTLRIWTRSSHRNMSAAINSSLDMVLDSTGPGNSLNYILGFCL